MTPEGKVKAKVTKVLKDAKKHGLYYYMPVPSGYGTTTLDYIGCFRGRFFAIETKAPKVKGKSAGKLTHQQKLTYHEMRNALGRVFIIDSDEDILTLGGWINDVIFSEDPEGYPADPRAELPEEKED